MSEDKEKKSFYKKWWFWAIIIITVSAISSNNNDNSNSSNPTSASTTSQQSKQTQNPSESVKPAVLSKEGEVSNVRFIILKSSNLRNVGSNQFAKATASGIFKIITLSVTNNQKDAITMDASLFKLIDDKDREFTDSTDGQMAIQIDEKEGLFLKSINPGLTVSGQIVFDVPPDAKGFKLKARGGMTGDEIELKVD